MDKKEGVLRMFGISLLVMLYHLFHDAFSAQRLRGLFLALWPVYQSVQLFEVEVKGCQESYHRDSWLVAAKCS
jgi:hypothetical protein